MYRNYFEAQQLRAESAERRADALQKRIDELTRASQEQTDEPADTIKCAEHLPLVNKVLILIYMILYIAILLSPMFIPFIIQEFY